MKPRERVTLYWPGEPEGTMFHNMPTEELIRFLFDNRPVHEEIPPALSEALHRLELSCQT